MKEILFLSPCYIWGIEAYATYPRPWQNRKTKTEPKGSRVHVFNLYAASSKDVAESGVLPFIYSSPFEIISKYVGSKVVGKSHKEEVLLEG